MDRSYISTVTATDQPPPASPTRRSSSTCAPVKNTSLNPCSPFIWCSGRTSMPGWPTSMMKKLSPWCLGTSLSVLASSIPRSAHWAPEVQTFCPSTVQPPAPPAPSRHPPARPTRVAHRPGLRAGQVGPGARLGEELAPGLLAAGQRGQEPGLLLLASVHEQHRPAEQLAEPGRRRQRTARGERGPHTRRRVRGQPSPEPLAPARSGTPSRTRRAAPTRHAPSGPDPSGRRSTPPPPRCRLVRARPVRCCCIRAPPSCG